MSKKTSDIEFLKTARERFDFANKADREDRENAAADSKFAAGNGAQWDEAARARRHEAHRPVLEWNRCTGFIAQVNNDCRQNKPSVKVTVMDGGSKATAEMLQSRIRHIEYESDADIAYDTSSKQQITCGRGFYRVTTRYLPKSMKQEARIERIENQFSVVFDPAAREYDRSDAEYCFVTTLISKDKFVRDYGKDHECVTSNWYQDSENPAPTWIGNGPEGMVQIAEYWRKEHNARPVVQLLNGAFVWKDELPEGAIVARDDEGNEIEREDDEVTIRQSIINGVEVLDETDWIGTDTPIIPVWGEETVIDGKRQTVGLIRPAKDPQRLINLYVSNIAEQIAMMPKAPWVMAEGQISGHEAEWEVANTDPKAVLLYKPVAVGGTLAGMPHREVNEPPIQALTIGLNQAIDGMKAACSIFDPSLGAKSNETSGIAIQRRQKESDVANFHFADNQARSRKLLGRILLQIIPILDKGPNAVATRDEQGKTKVVKVNQPYTDEETGEDVNHQLDAGSYGVAISTGPSYTSQRQEIFDTLSQIAANDKNFMSIAGDLMFRNMDAPGSEQLAERYAKTLPPQLQDAKPGQPQIPPQVQQQMQAMGQQHDQLVQTIHTLTDELMAKKAETDSRERIVAMQEETKVALGMAALNSKESLAQLENELAFLHKKLDQLHDANTQDAAQAHDQQMAQAAQQHQAGMQGAAQEHASDTQASDQAHADASQGADQSHAADMAAQAQDAAAAQQPEPKK